MKKFLLIAALLISALTANAQSVLGINFGSSYETVKEKLEQRFGRYSTKDDGGDIIMTHIKMGGIDFNYAEFNFQYSPNSSTSWFNGASFQKFYSLNDVEAAKRDRDYLIAILKEKYHGKYDGFSEYTNDQGFKCGRFGNDPTFNAPGVSRILGYICIENSKGKDCITRLYLMLNYGPLEYIDRTSDF